MNKIYKSLGMPAIELDESGNPSGPMSVDERNEELYDRDDQRKFHVPVFEIRNDFYSVMAKSATDAEAIVHERVRREQKFDLSGSCQIGPAIEA